MKLVSPFFAILLCSLAFFSTQINAASKPNKPKPQTPKVDATQEVNQLNAAHETATEQIVLGTFANLVQNFFNIVQNPHNSTNVGTNVTQMVAGIVSAALQIMKNLPEDITAEEKQYCLDELETTLRQSLRTLALAQKALKRTQLPCA
ncbi:MAG: hypothetical protein NTX86_03705 [Candidatus Dependentiae bacterium]|nr:hypothetical protein [Candidatus Dependentiae bacterium]